MKFLKVKVRSSSIDNNNQNSSNNREIIDVEYKEL